MKKAVRIIIKSILILGVILGFTLMMGESDNACTQVIWTFSWMAVMFLCGWVYTKLFPEDLKSNN